jgi:aminoglycoside phosphotransferase (APT) family kinase protein
VVRTEVQISHLTERLAPIAVQDLRTLTGGASSLSYSGTIAGASGDERRRVVVKVAPPGVAPVLNRDVLRQARVLRALGPTPVPVPEVLWEDPGAPPEVPPLFVMSFIDGTSFEPLFDVDGNASADDEAIVAERMRHAVRTLADLHSLEPGALGLTGEPRVALAEEIDRWSRALTTVDPALAPSWEEVAAALHASEPPASPAAVVHGDFRLGNVLATGARIAAVVDWEIWSVGDPRVDLGWFLVTADPATYRRATRYAASLPPLAELTEIYTGALGREVTATRWFQALACFKSTATWSLIVKHNRRRATPDPALERMAATLPHLLERARQLLADCTPEVPAGAYERS